MKKQKWNTTRAIAAGSLGALYAVLAISGAIITAIAGIPGVGGVTNAFFGAMIFAFCCFLIRKPGAATLTGLIYGICVLPLPVMGPPGFLLKIVIGASGGAAADLIYLLLKKFEKVAAIGVGFTSQVIIGLEIIGFGFLLSLPGIEKFAELFFAPITLLAVTIFEGSGGYLGYIIFNKLKNTSVVRKIQGG